MKKLLLFCLILSITFLYVAVVFADEAAKSETVNGWVSDSKCGAKGANAGAEACTKKCIAAGEKPVVVSDADQRVYSVENPDALKGHEGHHVSAPAIPVFISTASAPSSIAIVASDAVPTPASKISGTPVIISRKMRMLAAF